MDKPCGICTHSNWSHYERNPKNGQAFDGVCVDCLEGRMLAIGSKDFADIKPWHTFTP